jgi:hypothetical protein
MNRSESFKVTSQEIMTAYSHNASTSRRIYYEYNSKYRRIVVLENGSGFEICVSYKDIAKEYNKPWSTCWGEKKDALGWAKVYSENRNVSCGILTIIEKTGKQLI